MFNNIYDRDVMIWAGIGWQDWDGMGWIWIPFASYDHYDLLI